MHRNTVVARAAVDRRRTAAPTDDRVVARAAVDQNVSTAARFNNVVVRAAVDGDVARNRVNVEIVDDDVVGVRAVDDHIVAGVDERRRHRRVDRRIVGDVMNVEVVADRN